MSDIKWLPDGEEAFGQMLGAVPAEMRETARPQLLAMLAGKAKDNPVDRALIEDFVSNDLPEPQKTVLSAALGIGKKDENSGASLELKVEWVAEGEVNSPKDLATVKQRGLDLLIPTGLRITVGAATCGLAKGSKKVAEAFATALRRRGIDGEVVLVGSNGMSYAEPIVNVITKGRPRVVYGNVSSKDIDAILDAHAEGGVVQNLVIGRIDSQKHIVTSSTLSYGKAETDTVLSEVPEYAKLPFVAKQKKLLTGNAGTISPDRIEEYIAVGGYGALVQALTKMTPKDVLKEVKASKIRGRGGAGFPMGTKWQACAMAKSDQKYVVCNGSEGDPEIGMHKSFIESDPHAVIEGMILAGYAIGASKGIVYLNDRYHLAIERIQAGISQAEKIGLLGDNILGTDFSFSIALKRGGGAYICGEETALLNSLEGYFGEPRERPPLPVEKGLFGKPTVVNNLETLSNVPVIINKGGKWYASIGAPSSKGTKIISLSGNVAKPCWAEVPFGTTVGDIIETFGGGTDSGKPIKAFQTGGPSGGILPGKLLGIKLDYTALNNAGTMLGSGGLLVMDEDVDLLDMAKYFVDFFAEESCGKCTPCRYGMPQMQNLIGGFVEGRGTPDDLVQIKRLGEVMGGSCFCALGKSAAEPILSVLRHFEDDVNERMLQTFN